MFDNWRGTFLLHFFRTDAVLIHIATRRNTVRRVVTAADPSTDLGLVRMMLAELIDSADYELFHSILYNPHHVLHSTLPKETGSSYLLRRRRHNRELLNKSSRLVQSCFLVRMLYKDIY